jgi:hypothetical protein
MLLLVLVLLLLLVFVLLQATVGRAATLMTLRL